MRLVAGYNTQGNITSLAMILPLLTKIGCYSLRLRIKKEAFKHFDVKYKGNITIEQRRGINVAIFSDPITLRLSFQLVGAQQRLAASEIFEKLVAENLRAYWWRTRSSSVEASCEAS